MFRPVGAAVSIVALLLGFVAAPYAHVHQAAPGSAGGHDHHPRATTLLHLHVTPHSGEHDHPPVEDEHDAGQTMWSVGGFVFHPPSLLDAPAPLPVVLAVAIAEPEQASSRLSVTQPRAHGPPPLSGPTSPRAPPFVSSRIS